MPPPKSKRKVSSSSSSSSTDSDDKNKTPIAAKKTPAPAAISNNIKATVKRKVETSESSSDSGDSDSEQQQAAKAKTAAAAAKQKQQKQQLKQEQPTSSPSTSKPKEQKNSQQNANVKQSNNKKSKYEPEPDDLVDESDLDEADANDDRPSSTNSLNHHTSVLPRDMYNFCKYVLDLEQQKEIHLSSKKANCKLQNLLQEVPGANQEWIDLPTMHTSLKNMYHWATSIQETSMLEAIRKVMEFAQTESALYHLSGYPKTPAGAWNLFLRKHGKTSFKASKGMREKFKNKKDEEVIEAMNEATQCQLHYAAQLRAFLDQHKDKLFQSQIDQIQKKIDSIEKAYTPKEERAKIKKEKAKAERKAAKKKAAAAPKKPKQTAFDFYKCTIEKKYQNLPEEQREAKMRRKFDRLDDDMREMFEMIAAKYN